MAELDHGEFAGFTNAEIEQRHPGALTERAQNKYTWRFPGGESYQDLGRRASSALEQIAEAGWKSPLVVSHAMISRMLLRNLLDLNPNDALEFNLPHGVVLEVRPGARPPRRWLTN